MSFPNRKTTAEIISDAAIQLGLSAEEIEDPYASTDPNIVQLRTFLKAEGRRLIRRYAWSWAVKTITFDTVNDLIAKFSLDRVHGSPAVFDPKRLDDLNGRHIRAVSDEDLIELLEFHLPGTSKVTRGELIPMLRERMGVVWVLPS